MIPRLLAVLLAAFLVASCATDGPRGVDAAAYGKIHLRYAYAPGDDAIRAFDIYRAAEARGPFARVNRDPIKAVDRPATGLVQELMTDYGLVLGGEYFYYLEGIDQSGGRRKVTGISRATVELPLQPEDRGKLARIQEERAATARKGIRQGSSPGTRRPAG